MKSGIYIIRNIVNGKIYIGSAVNLEKRLYEHFWALRKNKHINKHLQSSWNKHTESSFTSEIYLTCKIKDLIFNEQLVLDSSIVRYGRENIYNVCPNAGSTLGRFHSEATKIKIGLTSKGRWTGKHHTEETKKKMSAAQKGRIITLEAREKLRIAHLGKPGYWTGKKRPPRSKEWQDKITKSLIGRKMSEKQKEKLRLINTGRPSPFKGKVGTRLGCKNKKHKIKLHG
jgi:group I intron endonuclease